MNSVTLSGVVSSKPEPSSFKEDKLCAKFTLQYPRGGRSCSVEIVTYEELAKKVLARLNKGDTIILQGALNQYSTKKGENVYQVVASEIPIRISAPAVPSEIQPEEPVKAPEPPQKEEKPLPQPGSNDLLGTW